MPTYRTPITELIEKETFARLKEAGLTPLIEAILHTPLDGGARSGMTRGGRLNKSAVAAELRINQTQLCRLLTIARCVLEDEAVPFELAALLPDGYKGRVENPPTTNK